MPKYSTQIDYSWITRVAMSQFMAPTAHAEVSIIHNLGIEFTLIT